MLSLGKIIAFAIIQYATIKALLLEELFDVFDTIAELKVFVNMPKVNHWRQQLQTRASVQQAVTKDYEQHLLIFLKQRNSYLSTLI